jgi:PAS domain S-box-containing protein
MPEQETAAHLVDGKYSVEDLVDLEKLRIVFDKFSDLTGSAIALVAYPSQKLLITAGWKDACTKFHRTNPESSTRCLASNISMTGKCEQLHAIQVESCENGLVDGGTPIIIKGCRIATLATGQVLFNPPDMEYFKQQAARFGYDQEAYLKAVSEIPVVSRQQFEKALFFLSEIALLIVEMGYQHLEIREKTVRLDHESAGHQQAEEALREKETRYRAIFDQTYQLAGLLQPDGTLIEANKTALDFIGANTESVLHKPFWDTPWWQHSKEVREQIRDAVRRAAGGEFIRYETSIAVKDGTVKYIDFSIKPIADETGKVLLLIPEGRDITDRRQAEEMIRLERDRAQTYLDVAGVIMVAIGPEQTVLLANKKTCEILGYEEGDIVGKNWFDLTIPETLRGKMKEVFNELMAGKIQVWEYFENPVVTRHGNERLIAWRNTLLKDPQGRILATLSSGEDITERRQSEEILSKSEKRYRQLIEQSGDGIFLLDHQGNFLLANSRTCLMLGYSQEEMLKLNILDTYPENHVETGRRNLSRLQIGEYMRFERLIKRKNGTFFPIEVSAVRVEDGKIQAIVRDITERKNREQIKTELISMVSHELRTPLLPIREGICVVLEGLTGEITEQQKDILSTSKSNIDRLIHLVNNFLDFQKFEAGVMHFRFEPLQINDIASVVHKEMTQLMINRELGFEFIPGENLPAVECDGDMIAQVLTNLVNNAVRFTRPGGNITLTTALTDGYIKISVRDTGIGIRGEDIPHLFRKFGQLEDGKSFSQGGTGLGLVISRRIVEEHGGRIWTESEFEKGSTFSFTLPVTPAHH